MDVYEMGQAVQDLQLVALDLRRRVAELEEQAKPPSPVMPPWPEIDPKMLEGN